MATCGAARTVDNPYNRPSIDAALMSPSFIPFHSQVRAERKAGISAGFSGEASSSPVQRKQGHHFMSRKI